MGLNDKKFQGIFHLLIIFCIPSAIVAFGLLENKLIGAFVVLAMAVLVFLVLRSR